MPRKIEDSEPEQIPEPLADVPVILEQPTAPVEPLVAFLYPTLGVTLFAKNQADADAQAAAHPLNKNIPS